MQHENDVEEKPAQEFSTKDLWVASALLTAGHKLSRIEWPDPRNAFFIFLDGEYCKATVEKYWDRTLSVIAHDFTDNMRSLKSRIFSEKKSP